MSQKNQNKIKFAEPPISLFLFGDTRFAWFWLLVRVYVGWQWVQAGFEKIISPAWTGSTSGSALAGFIKGALEKSSGPHADVANWYADFLNNFVLAHVSLFSYFVAFGEFLVGAALILGIFTGIAAFFGGFMNMNYLFAGTISINPVLFILELLLILAWRTAGWYGIDRVLLPLLGTPWQPGKIFIKES